MANAIGVKSNHTTLSMAHARACVCAVYAKCALCVVCAPRPASSPPGLTVWGRARPGGVEKMTRTFVLPLKTLDA